LTFVLDFDIHRHRTDLDFISPVWDAMAKVYATRTLSDKMTPSRRLLQYEHNYIDYEPEDDRIHLVRWDRGSTLRLSGNMWAEQKNGMEGRLVHSYVKRQVPVKSDSASHDEFHCSWAMRRELMDVRRSQPSPNLSEHDAKTWD
jgi:hypothetical protein